MISDASLYLVHEVVRKMATAAPIAQVHGSGQDLVLGIDGRL